MPRPAKSQQLGVYHAVLGRLLRQMGVDPRITPAIKEHVSKALNGVQELMLKKPK